MYNTRKYNAGYTQHAHRSTVQMDWTPVLLAVLFVIVMIGIIAIIA